MKPTLVLMVDWSAAASLGPVKPSKDRCWLAWGLTGGPPGPLPATEYFRTRGACTSRIAALASAHAGPVLIGLDFPIGYPRDELDRPVLPEGRALVEHVAAHVVERADGSSNRFEVAALLNQQIRAATGRPEGPFWAHPQGRTIAGLTFKKSRDTGVREYRRVERGLRDRGRNVQSPWKLMGAGAVGSQALVGLFAVARVLAQAQARGRLWPFEPIDRPDAIVVAEIWPSLGDFRAPRYASLEVADQKQVAAMWDWAASDPARLQAALQAVPPAATGEGWILGPLVTP